ncbi:MAG: hypothetical protein RLY14_2308, partial [Planctomycetota bacterium]
IGLIESREKLTRVSGEALDVSPLRLGVECINR